MFQVGAATGPSERDEVSRRLRAQIVDLATHPPTEAELSRYRQMLSGLGAMDQQRANARAVAAAVGERLGVPWTVEAYRDALAAVSAEDVRAAVAAALERGLISVEVRP